MSRAVLNVLQSRYGNGKRLTRADGNELHLSWAARENGDRPFSIRRKSTGASFTQLHRRCAVDLANGDGILSSGGFTGIFEQNRLPIARNVFRNVPIVPGNIQGLAVPRGSGHRQTLGVKTHEYSTIRCHVLQSHAFGEVQDSPKPSR